MKTTIAGVFILLGAAVAVLLSATTWAERERYAQFDAALQQIREFERLEVETRELVLAIRNGYLETFDRLVEADHALRRVATEFATSVPDAAIVPELSGPLAGYRSDVERFKSARSILRNSLRYLPEVAQEATIELGERGDIAGGFLVARAAVSLSQSFDITEDLNVNLHAVRDAHADAASVARFVRHAEMVMRTGGQLDRHVAALRHHELHDVLQRIESDLARHQAERGERIAWIGLAASVWSACLLGLMGFGLVLLRRTASELKMTNDGLEEKIRVRSAELAQAQKLESIGQLAAGIAHEINTPAQFVSDNLEFIDDSFVDLGPVFEALETVVACESAAPSAELVRLKEAVEKADLEFLAKELPGAVGQSRDGISRVAEIVRAMKDFSHPGAEGFQKIDLNRAIQSTVTVARNEWKYVADLSLELAEDLPAVSCHAGEINQSVLNVLVNAAHAIDARRGDETALGRIRVSTRREGEFARIEIADDGGGIPEEAQPRIFDPFFTTKGVGKGTGQGLSIAYRAIVEKHQGTIEFEVEPGVGTTFTIRLPIERAQSDTSSDAEVASWTRVLFVDDEQSVIDGLRRSLRRHCREWELDFATSGEQAIEKMTASTPDVLVSDMRMPGMDGAELLRTAQRRWPATVRLVLSGHSESEAIMRATLVAHQFLSKPCESDLLRATVERASALQRLVDDSTLRETIGEIDKLPPVPETYRRLTELLACEDVSLEMVAQVVARDPVVAAKLLQLVNSAFFGLSRSVSDVQEAVSFLGLQVVRDLVLNVGAFACEDVPESLRPCLAGVADRAMAVASVARDIAPVDCRDAAYAAGLLVDVGQVVIAARMPESFTKVVGRFEGCEESRWQTERNELGADHAQIGAFLLSQWGLPHDLTCAVAWHHRPSESGCTTAPLLTALHVADSLVEELADGGWRDGSALDLEYLEQAGATECLPAWRECAAATTALESE